MNPSDIGLSELIQQVKQELLTVNVDRAEDPPVFFVESVELELQVTVKKDAKAGIKVYVLEAGGGVAHDEVQKVKVSLTPLLTREEVRKLYQQRYPEKVKDIFDAVTQLTKGTDENLDEGII